MASREGAEFRNYSPGPAAGNGSRTGMDQGNRPVVAAFALPPLELSPGVLVHSRENREAAVETWLLLASPDAQKAQREWRRDGLTLLRCGGLFSAVRIPAAIIHAAAGTEDPRELTDVLGDALDGPVFYDRSGRQFYALTPHSTARLWRVPDIECLGSDFFLGVPATSVTEPDPRYRAWWVVPMDGPAVLCVPDAVVCFVQRGRSLVAAAKDQETRNA
ncbi:hypothetical protein GCM10017667_01620 [Streptomyces filamentosus]|uniref:Uncharacterized protein n=1 Tax=Streptomyces filamentosus TaxID=67294 RepID=A0A919BBI5_STRFL|nr:hypothetical protein GCM10017667_01620 [Streptomyces filamentosus]